jgi:hypothetical protein
MFRSNFGWFAATFGALFVCAGGAKAVDIGGDHFHYFDDHRGQSTDG